MSNRESIAGPRGDQTDRNGVKYATSELAAPAPIPRRIAKAKRDQRLRRITRELRRLAPHLDDQAFAPILQGFARVSVLLADSYEKVRQMDLIGEDGELRPSIETIRRLVDTQSKLAERLGLTPSTLKAMRKEKKADIVAVFANADNAE